MGQKVNPISMRIQSTKNWTSKWFASGKKSFANWLAMDIKLRRTIEQRFTSRAVIDRIDIERSAGQTVINIWTSKAGIVIGRGGAGVQELKAQ